MKQFISRLTSASVLALVMAVCSFNARAADPTERQSTLIGTLKSSSAKVYDKARACQQLGEIGTADAVPTLAALLLDPRLAAYARSGLEGIPHPAASAALREAVGNLSGPLLAGVVNSLGAVRDRDAAPILAKLARDEKSGAQREALMALGSIASTEAIDYLKKAFASAAEGPRNNIAPALLLAGDRERAAGRLQSSAALYELLQDPSVPVAFRVGATRGAILARTTDRVPFLIDQLRSGELPLRNAALTVVREIASDELASALNAELPRGEPELQGQLLMALVDCHNSASVAAIKPYTTHDNPGLRLAALNALGRLGADAAPTLVECLQRDLTGPEKATVIQGLQNMPGGPVNELLLRTLQAAPKPATRIEIIRLLESRRAENVSTELLTQASASDPQVAVAALSALTGFATPENIPALIALVKSSPDENRRAAAEKALARACSRAQDSGSEIVLSELKKAKTAVDKNSWVRVLTACGHPQALPAIQELTRDADSQVALNAIQQLGDWPDPSPVPALLKLAQPPNPADTRKQAVASLIQLSAVAADERQRPEAEIVRWMQIADASSASLAEKRRIAGILGRLGTADSLRLLVSYLENPELPLEAASGIIQIAPALARTSDLAELRSALQKVITTVPDEGLKNRARQAARNLPPDGALVRLFNGLSLSGWEGNTNVWRVQNAAILGGSMNGNPRNEFLATLRPYTNFVLQLEYKLVGTEGFTNGGVQFRSVRISNPPNEMRGYQADIGAGYSGSLYDESRRNKFLAQASAETIKKVEKPGDWNRYEIRCEGTHIQLWINGEKTVDYKETDPGIPQYGLIALQIHGDCKAEISFRNLFIQEL